MKTKKRLILIVSFLLFGVVSLSAQKSMVHGKVTTFNVIPVEKAEVTIKKTHTKVLTDSIGRFEIECKLKDKLTISAPGFKTKTIKVKNLDNLITVDLKMEGDESAIDLAVNEGYINKNNKAQTIKYFNLQNSYGYGYTDIIELIKGKFPQVNVVGDEILLRGTNSLTGKNGALIVLNGSPSDINTLKSLAVSEVEDIKILSGSAASRYGSGGGNGVIAVKLKSK